MDPAPTTMAELQVAPAAGLEDAEVFLSASDDEAEQPQPITPELLSALVKQVEFYFSDANLPTDKKLLKQIRKDPEGYVPVKLFANFRKVRALSKDVGIITEALRGASLLQLSQDCKRVKRIMPVPEYDISDIQRRTIVVENLPGNPSPTIESVTDMFRLYGRVKLVRICSRESKGKLPSWLTASCQNMSGQQHAYVEFEDEEGAILSAAALASESDAPDGAVLVRRLLACIAEQRERRSVNGANGSSYGGSSTCGGVASGSRKGSRDVSPQPRGPASSRRNSGGGMQYSSGGAAAASWGPCSSSMGGAGPEYNNHHHQLAAGHYNHQIPAGGPSYHAYHSYGGAYEHCGGSGGGSSSRRGSAGGAMSPSLAHLPPPPPPPPPRRSCDSAPASDLLPPASIPTPTLSARASNVYRPPSKRLSDGYTSTISAPPSSGAPHGVGGVPSPRGTSAAASALLMRSLGGSLGRNSCGGGSSACSLGGTSGAASSLGASTAPGSTVSTPVGAPASPPPIPYYFPSASSYICPSTGVTLAANSPPLSARGASVGGSGGRPPVHPPLTAVPPPPPPPPMPPSSGSTHPAHVGSLLAEAIAHAQAERRASEAGAKGMFATAYTSAVAAAAATSAVVPPGTPLMPQPTLAPPPPPPPAPAVAPTAAPRPTALTAPKFCLDLVPGQAPTHSLRNGSQRASPAGSVASSEGGRPEVVVAAAANDIVVAPLPAVTVAVPSAMARGGSQAQMVENVEDFINNILARPSARPTPVPAAGAAPLQAVSTALARKAPLTVNAPRSAGPSPSASSVEAAAAVAGILASTLRRPISVAAGPSTMRPYASSTGGSRPSAQAMPPAAAAPAPQQQKVSSQPLHPEQPSSRTAVVHITAFASTECEQTERAAMELADLDLNGQRVRLDLDGAHGKFNCSSLVNAKQVLMPMISLEQPPTAATHSVVLVATVAAGPAANPPTAPASPLPASDTVPSSPLPAGGNGASSAGGSGSGRKNRQAAASSGGNIPAGRSASATGPAPPQPGSKRLSKRDYANWAAATPGFRAEAASKYGSAGGAGMAAPPGSPPPPQSSAVAGGHLPSPASHHPHALFRGSAGGASAEGHTAASGPIWHVAKGPDGSRGFVGRTRAL